MASFVRASQRLVVTYQKSDGLPSPPSSKKSSAQPAALATTPAATVFPTQARIVSTPVAPPQVIHTSAYLQQTQQLVLPPVPVSSFEDEDLLQKQQADISSNALVWALQKVDDQLNQVEQQPSDVHRALYEFSNGPVGQATSKGVQAAAKITMTATIEAAKAAAPVGKWALQQGVKAAVGLVGAAMAQEQQRNKQQKQPGGTKQQKSKSRW